MKNILKMDYKKVLLIIFVFIITFFVTYKIINMIFYDYMFVVDMQKDGEYFLTNSHENGVSYKLEKEGDYYTTFIPDSITGYSLSFKLKLNEEDKRIEEVICNDKKLEEQNIIKLTDYTNYDISYKNMPLFMIRRNVTKKICATVGLAILTTTMISIILLKEKKKCEQEEKKFLGLFTYSTSFLKMLNKIDISVLVLIFLITFFVVVGCDAKVIANVGNLFAKDVDIYQLQVNSKLITGREYAEFPYNPLMLCIWGGLMTIFRPITQILPVIKNYPYFEVGVLKLFNLVFIFLTISSIISFLLDKKIIDNKKAKWIYYLSLFNPVTFYVAILFVQLDALTLYLVVLGLLLLNNINQDRFLGILLLSVGLMLKMQILFLLPVTLIAILYIIVFNNKDKFIYKIARIIKSAGIFIWISVFSFAILYLFKTPFYHLESNLAQSERLWFTTIQYTGTTYLFVALGALAVSMMLFVLNIHSKIKKENMIMAGLIFYGVIIYLFSFAILPTPSIYIVTLGATVIMLALEEDKLKNILFVLVSTLIIICPMFSDYGDISKIIKNPNEQGVITEYIQKKNEKDSQKINSITFTVSSVAMLTYAIYMGKESIKLLKEKE